MTRRLRIYCVNEPSTHLLVTSSGGPLIKLDVSNGGEGIELMVNYAKARALRDLLDVSLAEMDEDYRDESAPVV